MHLWTVILGVVLKKMTRDDVRCVNEPHNHEIQSE